MAQPAGVGPSISREMASRLRLNKSLLPKTRTASENGADVNLKGYESALITIEIGAPGDTLSGSVKQTWTVEEADDNGSGAAGTYAAAAAASLYDDPLAANLTSNALVIDAAGKASKVYQFAYIGTKQWVRTVCTLAGTHTNGTPCSGSVVKGNARVNPATL